MRVLLISTYDLGRQPFGLASPAAWLRREGHEVLLADTTRAPLEDIEIRDAEFVAFYLPMHTATRLATPLIGRVRRLNPEVHICGYGLYAPLNAEWLRTQGVNSILDGEFEKDLVEIAKEVSLPKEMRSNIKTSPADSIKLPRLQFLTPDRSGLPMLQEYAMVQMTDGTRRVVGSTESSRGCKHLCKHCPIVPVYKGQFRVIPVDVVLNDVAAQVKAGATHISFSDPDFFNGPRHATQIIKRLATEHTGITYDVTIKIEHLLRHKNLLPLLHDTGCLFITSAVESVDNQVLAKLAKGHTREDFIRVVELCRASDITLSPTFVPFTPWTTRDGYLDLIEMLVSLGLVEHVAPIQLAIRLLITAGSALLELEDIREKVTVFDHDSLTWPWQHSDAGVDDLQRKIIHLVGLHHNEPRATVFSAIADLASKASGRTSSITVPSIKQATVVPIINEPWYCCAEPDAELI